MCADSLRNEDIFQDNNNSPIRRIDTSILPTLIGEESSPIKVQSKRKKVKIPWTSEEDEILLNFLRSEGITKKWYIIAC